MRSSFRLPCLSLALPGPQHAPSSQNSYLASRVPSPAQHRVRRKIESKATEFARQLTSPAAVEMHGNRCAVATDARLSCRSHVTQAFSFRIKETLSLNPRCDEATRDALQREDNVQTFRGQTLDVCGVTGRDSTRGCRQPRIHVAASSARSHCRPLPRSHCRPLIVSIARRTAMQP